MPFATTRGSKSLARILIVNNAHRFPGGEETVVENEAKLLRDHGHQVVTYIRSNQEVDSRSLLGKLVLPAEMLFSSRTYRDVRHLIRSQDIDVVHVHNTFPIVSHSVYDASHSLGVPVVQTIHNFRWICVQSCLLMDGKVCERCLTEGRGEAFRKGCYGGSRPKTAVAHLVEECARIRGLYKGLDATIFLTDFNRDLIASRIGLPTDRVHIKPNFVQPHISARNWGDRDEKFIFVGRLDPSKGTRVLLEAFSKVPGKKLLVVGEGPDEGWMKDYISKHGMENVEMIGRLSNKETIRAIGRCQALVFPTQCYEGLPMVIVEAFSAGTPVVASNLGNSASLISEGVNGVKFDPCSPRELADIISSLSKEDLTALHKGALCEYEKKYSAEENYRKLAGIYEKVLHKKKGF